MRLPTSSPYAQTKLLKFIPAVFLWWTGLINGQNGQVTPHLPHTSTVAAVLQSHNINVNLKIGKENGTHASQWRSSVSATAAIWYADLCPFYVRLRLHYTQVLPTQAGLDLSDSPFLRPEFLTRDQNLGISGSVDLRFGQGSNNHSDYATLAAPPSTALN